MEDRTTTRARQFNPCVKNCWISATQNGKHIENQIVEENAMDVVEPNQEQPLPKKAVSILDTRMAVRTFKMCADGLEAFAKACNRKKTGGSTP